MKRYYYVTFDKGNEIYCVSIVDADKRETVVAHYEGKGCAIVDIHPATRTELLEGKRKHMPFVEL